MIVRELITKIGFDYDGSALKRAESGIFSLKNGLKALAAYLTAGAVAHFFTSAADSAEALIKASQKTGIGVEGLQRLGYAAHLSDIEMGSLEQSLGFLSRNLVAAKEGSKEASEAFQKALGKGVNLKSFKDNEQLLLALSERFQKMPDGAEKAALAMKLFGRSGKDMIPFLNQGPEAIRAAGKELEAFGGVLGVDALEAGNKFNDNMKRVTTFFLSLRNVLAAKLFPYINKTIDAFVEWLKVNKDIIRSGIEEVFQLIGVALRVIGRTIETIVEGYHKLSDAIGSTKAAVLALSAAIVIALGPTGAAIAALVTAVILVVDDIQAYLRGEPSFFGPIYDWIADLYKKIEAGVNDIIQKFADFKLVLDTDIIPIVKKLWELGKMIFEPQIEAARTLIGVLKTISDTYDAIKAKVLDFLGLTDTYNQVAEGIQNTVLEGLKKSVIGALPGGGLYNLITDSSIGARANDIRASQGGSTTKTQNNNLKVEQKIEVNVQTGADPNAIGQSIQDQTLGPLGDLLRQASYDLEPGAEN